MKAELKEFLIFVDSIEKSSSLTITPMSCVLSEGHSWGRLKILENGTEKYILLFLPQRGAPGDILFNILPLPRAGTAFERTALSSILKIIATDEPNRQKIERK